MLLVGQDLIRNRQINLIWGWGSMFFPKKNSWFRKWPNQYSAKTFAEKEYFNLQIHQQKNIGLPFCPGENVIISFLSNEICILMLCYVTMFNNNYWCSHSVADWPTGKPGNFPVGRKVMPNVFTLILFLWLRYGIKWILLTGPFYKFSR